MKLKLNLLLNILDNPPTANKYSKSFLNLKNVLDLEKRNNYIFKDPSVYSSFKNLKKKYDRFMSHIPLVVVERYFNDHKEDQNKFIYLEYQNHELSDLKIMELFNELEIFFEECFSLACLIADLYNFEVKFNESDESNNDNQFI